METIQYTFKVLAYLGGLLAIFELLPKARRERIEVPLIALLTWRRLRQTLFIAVAAHVVFRLFPYISPFALVIAFFTGSLVLSLGMMASLPKDELSDNKSSRWMVFTGVAAMAILVSMYFLNLDERILIAVSSVFLVAWSAPVSEGYLIAALAYFLFFGVPCLLSYWPGPSALNWILAPYHWFTDEFVPKSYGILPTYSPEEFSSAYKASNSFMTDWLPWFIYQSSEVRRFLLASDGYLLIFGALAEVLFVYYLWKLIALAFLSIAVPLMRVSDYLKTHIDKDRLPIAGIIIGLVGKTGEFAIATIRQFTVHT